MTLPVRAAAGSFALLGAVGLAIAMLGLYAVAARTVRLRTREIGVRIAFGANAAAVRSLVLRQSLDADRRGLVPRSRAGAHRDQFSPEHAVWIGALDLVTFVGVPACLVAAGLLAALRPARRASRVDPTVALREL